MCKDQPRDEKTGRFQSGPPNATAFKKGDPRAADAARNTARSRVANKRGRDLLRALLEIGVNDPIVRQKLVEQGFCTEEISQELAIHQRQIERAIKTGDPRSYTAVMRAAGYDTQDLNIDMAVSGSEDAAPVIVFSKKD
jgi:hypothetical protein